MVSEARRNKRREAKKEAKESKHAGKQPASSAIAESSAMGSEQSEGGLVPNDRVIDANTRIKFLDHVPMVFVESKLCMFLNDIKYLLTLFQRRTFRMAPFGSLTQIRM
jgi:hypothetical protein